MKWKITLAVISILGGAAAFLLYPAPQPADTLVSIAPPAAGIVQEPEQTPELIQQATDTAQAAPVQLITEQTTEQETLIAPPEQLDGSDPQVLKAVADIAPKLAVWLLPKQQLRKWVLTIDLLAEGELPIKYPPLNFPMSPFKVEKSGDVIKNSTENYSRADSLVNVITAIDPKVLASYYQYWRPTLERAYSEQGKPGNFDQRLRQAIDKVLGTEPLTRSATLQQPHVFYQYTDGEYEQRSQLNKLMWRLGTANMTRVQDFLQQFQANL